MTPMERAGPKSMFGGGQLPMLWPQSSDFPRPLLIWEVKQLSRTQTFARSLPPIR